MGLRDDLTKRVQRKQAEIAALEQQMAGLTQQISIAKAYKDAMEEALRLTEREALAPEQPTERSLRRNSGPAKAHKALTGVGHPLHVTKLLAAIGKPVNRVNRSALSAGLSAYARAGRVFTRPAPNTFGLAEWGDQGNANLTNAGSDGGSDEGDLAPDGAPHMRLAR